MLAGAVKVRLRYGRKYAGSKVCIRLKYSKSTVKYGKNHSTIRKLFLAPTVLDKYFDLLVSDF